MPVATRNIKAPPNATAFGDLESYHRHVFSYFKTQHERNVADILAAESREIRPTGLERGTAVPFGRSLSACGLDNAAVTTAALRRLQCATRGRLGLGTAATTGSGLSSPSRISVTSLTVVTDESKGQVSVGGMGPRDGTALQHMVAAGRVISPPGESSDTCDLPPCTGLETLQAGQEVVGTSDSLANLKTATLPCSLYGLQSVDDDRPLSASSLPMEVSARSPTSHVRFQLRAPSTEWVQAAHQYALSVAAQGMSMSRSTVAQRRNHPACTPCARISAPTAASPKPGGSAGIGPHSQHAVISAASFTGGYETRRPDIAPRIPEADFPSGAAFPFPVRMESPASFYPTPTLSPDIGGSGPEPLLSGDLGVLLRTSGEFSSGLLLSLDASASRGDLTTCPRIAAQPEITGLAKISGALRSPKSPVPTRANEPALGCCDGTLFVPPLKDVGEDALRPSKIPMSEIKQMEELDVTWSAMMTSVLDSDCVGVALATEINWTDNTLCGVETASPLGGVLPSPDDGMLIGLELPSIPLALSRTADVHQGIMNASKSGEHGDTNAQSAAIDDSQTSTMRLEKVKPHNAVAELLKISMTDVARTPEEYIPDLSPSGADAAEIYKSLSSACGIQREELLFCIRAEPDNFGLDGKDVARKSCSVFAKDTRDIHHVEGDTAAGQKLCNQEFTHSGEPIRGAAGLATELGTVGERVKRNRERIGRASPAATACAYNGEGAEDDISELTSVDEDDSDEYHDEDSSDGEFAESAPNGKRKVAAVVRKVPRGASGAAKTVRRNAKRSVTTSGDEVKSSLSPTSRPRRRVSTFSSSGSGSGSGDNKRSGRPYECTTCGAAFSRGHDLRRHERIHSQVRDFQCDMCGRRFSRRDALKRHEGVCRSGGKCKRARRTIAFSSEEDDQEEAPDRCRRPARRVVKRVKARSA